jgi:small subunit ribosomal protein S2
LSTTHQDKVTIKGLVESGAHFGHQTRRWNPKMKRFIFEKRNGIYIIDLSKTLTMLRAAIQAVQEVVGRRKDNRILFVGTKKQAQEVIETCAKDCGEFYIRERWLGGTLTNLSTIRNSVTKLEQTEAAIASGQAVTKKELHVMKKAHAKNNKNLCGVRDMKKLPGLLIVVDPNKEDIAVAEANKLGIPVMALVDTNCDPEPIEYIIPCNADALKSIKIVLSALTKAIIEKKNEMNITIDKGDENAEDESADEESSED